MYLETEPVLNFTKIDDMTESKYNISPRLQFSRTACEEYEPSSANVLLIDTELEKQIMLGPDYPYGPLEAGECIINSGILIDNPLLKVGDTIHVEIELEDLIKDMSKVFNRYYREPGARNVYVTQFTTTMPCIIKEIMSEPYGKYNDDRQE